MDKALLSIIAFYYLFVLGLGIYMFRKRKAAVKSGEVKASHFKDYTGETTKELQVMQNHFNSHFQVPVMFFIASLINLQQKVVSELTLVLALIFVFSRLIHCYIHLGSNHVLRRAAAYFVGVLVVGAMFIMPLFA